MSSCNFLEVCRDVTKTARKIPQSDYLSQGNYKIFDQGKQYIAGYTNDSEGIVSDYPYIVFGDHTRILKIVAEPCFIGADGVKLLKVYNEDFTPQYVYYALLAQPIENQGYSRHFKYLKELNIAIYTKEEQNAIVSELDKIQAALDNKKEQLKKLDELIQAKFYEMFGDPVVNDKGWEIKDFGILFSLKSGDALPAKKMIDGEYSVYGGNGISGRHNTFNKDGKYLLIGRVGAYCGNVRMVEGKFWLTDNAFELIENSITFNKPFLLYLLRFLNLGHKANRAAQPVISNIALKDVQVILPSLSLQQAFAAYVEKVEQAKAIVNQEIAHLQELLNSRMDFYFRK